MDKRQKIALIFSGLSFVVALANVAYGVWVYIPALVLFGLSYFLKKEWAVWLQIFAITIIGIYIGLTQDEYCGYLILFTALMLLFSHNSKYMIYYILGYSIAVLVISFFTVGETKNKIVHIFLDASLFSAYSVVIWVIFNDALVSLNIKEEQYRDKYMHIIEEATSVAREALDRLEKLKADKDAR